LQAVESRMNASFQFSFKAILDSQKGSFTAPEGY
jgi:hypothetical protein